MATRAPAVLRALGRGAARAPRAGAAAPRALSTGMPEAGDKRFVRISGVSSYAGLQDVKEFMVRNGVEVPAGAENQTLTTMDGRQHPMLAQGQADVFQNQSVWVYDAGSQDAARDASDKLAGKVIGMKLARAAVIDSTLVANLFNIREGGRGRTTLRARLGVIAPTVEERGRTVICTNLEPQLSPRSIWSFFATFDVVDVKLLRRSGVASVVFRTRDEAVRAIRERSNMLMHNTYRVQVKLFD